MKKFVIALLLLTVSLLELKSQQPPFFWREGHNFGINAGYKKLSLNCGDFEAGFVEISCFMRPSLGWEFTTKFEYGPNYLSFSPSGLIGLPFWVYSSSHGGDSDSNALGAILSVASAKLPIYIMDWLEVCPYWDILKFSKLYKSKKFRVNGDLGLQIKLYPFCTIPKISTFFISGFCLYNFAYKKDPSAYNNEPWSNQRKRSNKSPFFGYSYGATIGCYF